MQPAVLVYVCSGHQELKEVVVDLIAQHLCHKFEARELGDTLVPEPLGNYKNLVHHKDLERLGIVANTILRAELVGN